MRAWNNRNTQKYDKHKVIDLFLNINDLFYLRIPCEKSCCWISFVYLMVYTLSVLICFP